MDYVDIIFRWSHVLFGITWIGLLYYFNFIQGEYFKEAEASAKSDAVAKLAPRALWWFRWGAMFTFLTGVVLLHNVWASRGANGYIIAGALMGTLMFLNVWLIIWPNQKIVCGIVEGDGPAAGAKALLASRTNTLFSGPMLLGMMGSFHGVGSSALPALSARIPDLTMSNGLIAMLVIILLLEANAIFGKVGPMASVKGVIHSSLALTVIMMALFQLL